MIKPIGSKVLVKAFLGDAVSAGGIVVPDSFRKEGCRVKIVAVGNGTKKSPMLLKPEMIGFRVADWGVPVIENGEQFYIMESSAILAIENN